jgi:DNA gyrase subunit A
VENYRLQRRGGKGVINVKMTDRTGHVVAIKDVHERDELVLITRQGIVNRQPVDSIRVIGRNTQGVKLVNLGEGDCVMDVARVANEDEEPRPIESGDPDAAQEIVASEALEEILDVEGEENGLDDDAPEPLDELVDEIEDELPDEEDFEG